MTLYNKEHFFHPNDLGRYSLGTKNQTLQRNEDGSLTLYAGAASPGDDIPASGDQNEPKAAFPAAPCRPPCRPPPLAPRMGAVMRAVYLVDGDAALCASLHGLLSATSDFAIHHFASGVTNRKKTVASETIAQLTTSSRTLPRRSTTPPSHGMRRICNPRDAASSERFSASSSLSTLARKICRGDWTKPFARE